MAFLLDAGCGGGWTHGIECYRQADFEKAKQLFLAQPYPFASMWLAYVEADSNPKAALKTYDKYTLNSESNLWSNIDFGTIPLLLGEDLENIRSRFKDIAVDPDVPALSPWHQFFLGHADEGAALEMCDIEWKNRPAPGFRHACI